MLNSIFITNPAGSGRWDKICPSANFVERLRAGLVWLDIHNLNEPQALDLRMSVGVANRKE
jgi:hypothetical protein